MKIIHNDKNTGILFINIKAGNVFRAVENNIKDVYIRTVRSFTVRYCEYNAVRLEDGTFRYFNSSDLCYLLEKAKLYTGGGSE